jgi:hypothetical protein
MSADIVTRQLPVRPNLDQLKRQAKDLLSAMRAGDSAAIQEFNEFHPNAEAFGLGAERRGNPQEVFSPKLADVQLALARSYQVASWPRLVHACKLIDAIWRDDIEALRALLAKQPQLLHEMALVTPKSNWGPPMSYAANLGRNQIIRMLHELGAKDHLHALDRATLQGRIDTARMLHQMIGAVHLPDDCLEGPAYTLSAAGTALMFELGARVSDENGKSLAPVHVVLETDSRKPSEKHRILELYLQQGVALPDTPPMAVHRGRIDLLEQHLRRDPRLLQRTFTHAEIFPPELGCHDEVLATQGTPLAGATLLHMCVDYDEIEMARWLLEHGMDVDAKASVDAEGFGGHTALFATVVSQPNYWMNHFGGPQVALFTELLLDPCWNGGADPNVRASLRKQLHPGYVPKRGDGLMHEYRDVTPLSWGKRFHSQIFVSEPALRLIEERGGHD